MAVQEQARPDIGPLFSVDQVCGYLGVSRPTAYALMNSGQLPFLLIGTRRRIAKRDLEAFAEKGLSRTTK